MNPVGETVPGPTSTKPGDNSVALIGSRSRIEERSSLAVQRETRP